MVSFHFEYQPLTFSLEESFLWDAQTVMGPWQKFPPMIQVWNGCPLLDPHSYFHSPTA